ncbi:MAG: hypothetical protein A2020_05050 [Lentisphaerae bacterium GWF2_45_14]|nr:MAG: hypothetical protein A2020_05050 [Lentisphaerae bacterium GWF2_45_14]
MKKRLLIALFILATLAQFAVPSSMIYKYETVLGNGEVFRFKTAPVDPSDPFRGKYVTLSIENDSVKNTGHLFSYGESVFLVVENDKDGFAYFSKASKEKPATSNYYKTRCKWADGGEIRVQIGFDRYYMNEEKAPEAERRYNARRSKDASPSWVSVRILNGTAVIEDLFINGVSVNELLKGTR